MDYGKQLDDLFAKRMGDDIEARTWQERIKAYPESVMPSGKIMLMQPDAPPGEGVDRLNIKRCWIIVSEVDEPQLRKLAAELDEGEAVQARIKEFIRTMESNLIRGAWEANK
jgi:hypothetical protein